MPKTVLRATEKFVNALSYTNWNTDLFKLDILYSFFCALFLVTDTALERNALMENVYPKIKEYCREKHGLEFQVRWSLSRRSVKPPVGALNSDD